MQPVDRAAPSVNGDGRFYASFQDLLQEPQFADESDFRCRTEHVVAA